MYKFFGGIMYKVIMYNGIMYKLIYSYHVQKKGRNRNRAPFYPRYFLLVYPVGNTLYVSVPTHTATFTLSPLIGSRTNIFPRFMITGDG